MARGLRILIVEDMASDADLMAYELQQANLPFTSRRVEDDVEFLQELEQFHPDLILSDFHLPHFNGLAALALAQERCPEVPFIFVSGAIGEEVAIDSLKRGATDYVLKDRLTRLAPAVKRALRRRRTGGSAARPRLPCGRANGATGFWWAASPPWFTRAMPTGRWISSTAKLRN